MDQVIQSEDGRHLLKLWELRQLFYPKPAAGLLDRFVHDALAHGVDPAEGLGFNPIGLRAAIEMCGVDRVVFGTVYGAVPCGVAEHVQIVEDVVPDAAERDLVFWKTSNQIFGLGLEAAAPRETSAVLPLAI